MVKDSYNYLSSLQIYKSITLEVPFLSRCIDMVIVTNDDKIITIEFKIQNLNHAIRQAQDHALGSHYPCICIPERKAIDLNYFIMKNIGLMYYNQLRIDRIRILYLPVHNQRIVAAFNKNLFEIVEKVNSFQ
jgi:hypothetical protein